MYERIALALVALFLGCGSSSSDPPVDVLDFNGEYTGTSTNGMSSCPETWNTGHMADGAFNLMQSGSDIQVEALRDASVEIYAAFGSNSFSGKVAGSHVDAAIVGSAMYVYGACMYAWKGTIAADLAGNTLNGRLTYTSNTGGDANCVAEKVSGCTRVTDLAYKRPPK